MTIEATCPCRWSVRETNVSPADRTTVRKMIEWEAHVHELRGARRAYQHDTTVTVKAA